MAKKKQDEKILNYTAEVRLLKQKGPGRLYFLWGVEDYLKEQYLTALKSLCLPEEDDSFSYHRLNGPDLDPRSLRDAVDAMPFLCERSFVEIRDAEFNKLTEPEECLKILEDIPDYCTVAFVQSAEFMPDGRLKFIKALRGIATELNFTKQSQGMMTEWIARRFSAAGKTIDLEAAQRLMFISGELMNRLIPEIEKIAAYTKGDKVTIADVEAVANHIPEADIFDMTDLIAQKKYNAAMGVLSELMSQKENEPIYILAILGIQMRRLYAAKLAQEQKLGTKYVMEVCALKNDYVANMLLRAAKGYSLPQLRQAVRLCAETDYKMKSSGGDAKELLRETVLRIASGESDAQR